MNRTDIVKQVSKETGIEYRVVNLIFNSIISIIYKNILLGINVRIQGFLNFNLKTIKGKMMRNPRTNKEVFVPKHYKVNVIVPKSFSNKLKNKIVY